LWFAIVGAFIRALSFLPPHIAAGIPVVLSTLFAAYALWYATYYLAKTPAAQPLALALGGQPKPIAYARAVADGAVLMLLATFGIALRMHEINAQTAQFALLCGLMFGATLSLYKPIPATAITSFILILLGSTTGLLGVLPALVWLTVLATLPAWRVLRYALPVYALSAVLGFALPFAVAYLLGQHAYVTALWAWNSDSIGIIPWTRLTWLLSNLPFFGWPAVPFAAAAIWRWRRYWRAPHVWAGIIATAWRARASGFFTAGLAACLDECDGLVWRDGAELCNRLILAHLDCNDLGLAPGVCKKRTSFSPYF
jgi:hypothetical protein